MSLGPKLRSWQFPRYWRFNKQYYNGYQLICLISWPILIASRHDWYRSKGLFKGFPYPLRLWESSKNWWRYDRMKFVTLPPLLVRAPLRSYLVFGILWRYSCSFSPAFCKFSSGFYVSSPWVYPFHLTRYSFFLCLCCKSRIFSTSHSFWPCIKVGGGGVAFWPQMVDSEYWVNLLAWKTRCSAR